MTRHPEQSTDGFTIIEVLVALVLSSVVIFFVYRIFESQNRLQVDEHQKMTLQQDGRAALNLMAQGMRIAGYAPKDVDATAALNGESVSAGLTTAAMDSLTWTCDLNENGKIDGGESVTYRLSATAPTILERTVGGGTEPLLNNVAAFSVLYAWDNEGPGSDGYGDLEPAGAAISWCYDSDGDDRLDRCYDSDGLAALTLGAPAALIPSVPLEKARGARLWLLLGSERKKLNEVASDLSFVVPSSGDDAVNGMLDTSTLDAHYVYRLFTTTVKLRNMYFQ